MLNILADRSQYRYYIFEEKFITKGDQNLSFFFIIFYPTKFWNEAWLELWVGDTNGRLIYLSLRIGVLYTPAAHHNI